MTLHFLPRCRNKTARAKANASRSARPRLFLLHFHISVALPSDEREQRRTFHLCHFIRVDENRSGEFTYKFTHGSKQLPANKEEFLYPHTHISGQNRPLWTKLKRPTLTRLYTCKLCAWIKTLDVCCSKKDTTGGYYSGMMRAINTHFLLQGRTSCHWNKRYTVIILKEWSTPLGIFLMQVNRRKKKQAWLQSYYICFQTTPCCLNIQRACI